MAFLHKRGKYWYIYDGNTAHSLKITDGEAAKDAFDEYQYNKGRGALGLVNFRRTWPELKAKFLERFSERDRENKTSSYQKYVDTFRHFDKYTKPDKLHAFQYENALDFVNSMKNGTFVTPGKGGTWAEPKGKIKPYSLVTINIAIRNLKTVFRFAVDLKWIQENPFQKVQEIPIGKKIPKDLTEAQVSAVLDEARRSESDLAYLMVLTYYYTGIRRATLPVLKNSMVDLKRGALYLRGTPEWKPKDGDDAILPLHPVLVTELRRYARTRQDASEYLFPGRNGGQRDKYSIGRLLNKFYERAGIQRTGVHVFRHTFGTHLMRKSPPSAVQKAMGHSDLETTMVYTHVNQDQVDAAIRTLPDVRRALPANDKIMTK